MYSWMINLGSINSRANMVAFKWTLVVGSLAFIIHSLPCLTERCTVCLRVNSFSIERNLVWLHYKNGHWILADMKSTNIVSGWSHWWPGWRFHLLAACALEESAAHFGVHGWVPVSTHWGVQSWGLCFNAYTCNLVHGPPSISILLGNGVQTQARTCW